MRGYKILPLLVLDVLLEWCVLSFFDVLLIQKIINEIITATFSQND
jgi:hypothetical protein